MPENFATWYRGDAHLVEGVDDLLRDDVVPAAEARVDLLPSYSAFGRPSRFVLGAGAGAGNGGLGAHRGQPFFPDVSRSREDALDNGGRDVEGEAVVLADGTKRAASSGNSSRRIVTSWLSRFCSTT